VSNRGGEGVGIGIVHLVHERSAGRTDLLAPGFDAQAIAVAKRRAKVGLEMNDRQPDATLLGP
jgi:hypothetical protein